MTKAEYSTHWLSNQCATSLFDRSFSELAHLCDSVTYTADNYLDSHESNPIFDEILFLPFKDYVLDAMERNKNFCILHLMGSHYRYDLRYPRNYAKFSGSDYEEEPENRRETFAKYDNSILYNDFVVDSIMNIADSLDAIVIYMPDHGFDFYYTRDIASHGRLEDPASFKAGCQIPFMIYFTKQFRDKHPEILELTREVSKNYFNTKYLMNTILEMAGYDICEYDIFKHSIFQGKFAQSTEYDINQISN